MRINSVNHLKWIRLGLSFDSIFFIWLFQKQVDSLYMTNLVKNLLKSFKLYWLEHHLLHTRLIAHLNNIVSIIGSYSGYVRLDWLLDVTLFLFFNHPLLLYIYLSDFISIWVFSYRRRTTFTEFQITVFDASVPLRAITVLINLDKNRVLLHWSSFDLLLQ